MSPKVLDQVLAKIPRVTNGNVLVGFDTSDDAGVFRLTPECALVQTVDFFTPIVDDPYTYGAIAAANALSDVYAMGGLPITALSILAYPGKGDLDDLEQILAGGAAKIHEAGCVILGGHSVTDEEIKFGYAITGTVHPERVLTNAGARPGDVLLFTKRIGTGVIATALKRGIAAAEHVAASTASMLTLNRAPCQAMLGVEVHACTDASGFGLLGHAREIAAASRVTLEIDANLVQFLPGALEYARAGAVPGGLKNNRDFVGPNVRIDGALPAGVEDLLYDPQTSGGLLIALPETEAGRLESQEIYRIGRVREFREKAILIV
ncbi:MAG: selenide, water dikinase SelD [Bryobacteraceae bacterium]